MPVSEHIAFVVNGTPRELDVEPRRLLVQALREDLDLTGTHVGCDTSQCGACTVLLDGEAVRSCVTQVGRAANKSITTIEGLEENGKLTPLQEAFIQADALQCAFCTSGMIVSATALLKEVPKPTRAQIIDGMSGNICRCGVYERIINAIQIASGQTISRKEPTK
jgi:aerobic-type carbon monoxide dehydrogenase small subunit (CoxS/CutS family)